MRDEGVIKFKLNWREDSLESSPALNELIRFRNVLFQKGLIGVYPDGIGFGNISVRVNNQNGFLISGSQTGEVETASPEHFSKVETYDIDQNKVVCSGPSKASSESLTHAMIYELDATIQAIVHVHHAKLWKALMHTIPTTSAKVPYGTPEMAGEMERLFQETDLKQSRVLVMAGHEDGVVSFGFSIEEAVGSMLKEFERI